ncbi:hypothetical protein QNM99_28385 [Pseudomonas sp. PCH446]
MGRPLAKGGRLEYRGVASTPRGLSGAQVPDFSSSAPLQVVLGRRSVSSAGKVCSMHSTVSGPWTVAPIAWGFACWGRS